MDIRNKLVVNLFYLCNFFYKSKFRLIFIPLFLAYRFFAYWILGTDIHYKTNIDRGLVVYHGVGLVINPNSVLGKNIVLRHGVTIGNYEKANKVSGCPTLGDNINIGCGAVILGDIIIGDNVDIYANAIVTKCVPSNSICFGYNKTRPKDVH